MIKLESFNLKAALNGEPVMLRDGSKAFVRHQETETFIQGNFNLVGIKEGHQTYQTWTPEGNYDTRRHEYDIISMYPKTRIINGFEVPAPETEEPKNGDWVFTSDIYSEEFYDEDSWRGRSYELRWLKRGLIFLNAEDAIANTKAMLGIDPYS